MLLATPARDFVLVGEVDDETTYRLDQALADHLRRDRHATQDERRIVEALLTHGFGSRNIESGLAAWQRLPSYTLGHLAEHAASAGMLDRLLEQPAFVLLSEPSPLLRSLPHVRTERGRRWPSCAPASATT